MRIEEFFQTDTETDTDTFRDIELLRGRSQKAVNLIGSEILTKVELLKAVNSFQTTIEIYLQYFKNG